MELSKTQNSNKTQGRFGFSLVELIVVSLITAILAAVAIPNFVAAQSGFKVKAAAARVAADLRFARHRAKLKGTTQAIDFYPATDSYDLTGLDSIDSPGNAYTVDLGACSAKLVSVTLGEFGTDTGITFDMYGKPNYGGAVEVSVGGQVRKIQVEELTGKVSVLP